MTAHHTLIFCENGRKSINSPEGIRQDGMDFIMSAFVIDRQNINGAKSIIYANDKK
ncbi:2OG-Fe dioxygenase family protein [Campylobacter lanienae]|uniref:2OG-Fe dioxygenase family protein n=1 Tax=Campylobacter lanienae TaxID=75658 RepID=UPI003AFA702D